MKQATKALPALFVVMAVVSCGRSGLLVPAFSPFDSSLMAVPSKRAAVQGWQLVLAGNRVEAMRFFKRGGSAEALAGRAILDYSAGNYLDEGDAWLELISKFAFHPLAMVAAARLERLTRTGTRFDSDIVRVATRTLNQTVKMDPWARYWLRVMLARVMDRSKRSREAGKIRSGIGYLKNWSQTGPFGRYPSLESFDAYWPNPKAGKSGKNVTGPGLPKNPFFTAARIFHPAETNLGQVVFHSVPARGGVFYARTVFENSKTETAWFCMSSSSSFALFLDGKKLFARDRYRNYTPDARCVPVKLAPGNHLVVTSVISDMISPSFTLFVQPLDKGAEPLRQPKRYTSDFTGRRWAGFDRQTGYLYTEKHFSTEISLYPKNPLPRLWFALVELFLGDEVGAEKSMSKALEIAGHSGVIDFLAARMVLVDHALPVQERRAAARAGFETCRKEDPGAAACLYWLSILEGMEGRPKKQLSLLKQALANQPDAWLWLIRLHKILARMGWKAEAEDALDSLKAVDPGAAVDLQRRWANRNRRFHESGELTKLWASMNPRSIVAARKSARAGQVTTALAEVERILSGMGPSHWLLKFKAGLLAEIAEYGKAAGILLKMPWELPSDLKKAAMYEAMAGDMKEAYKNILRGVRLQPEGGGLTLQAAIMSGVTPLQEFRLDAEKILSGLKAVDIGAASHGASAELLLDQYVLDLSRPGPGIELVHTLRRILTKKAVQEMGEVRVPQDAWLLNLRVIKPDGHILEPEDIAGKDTVSLPGLEPGDAIDFEYLSEAPYSSVFAGGFLSDAFFFRTNREPVRHSQVIIRAGPGQDLEINLFNHAKEPVVKDNPDGGKTYTWEAHDLDPIPPEPVSVPAMEYLPYLKVGMNVTRRDLYKVLSSLVPERVRLDRRIREFAEKAVHGMNAPRDKTRAVFKAVLKKVISDSGGIRSSAAYTLARGKGSRVMLLTAALRAVGVPADVVAVKPFSAPRPHATDKGQKPLPSPGEYTSFVVRARPDRRSPVWLDVGSRFGEFDYLRPGFQESPAIVLSPQGPAEITTPAYPASRERHEVALQVDIHEDGSARLKGVELFRGWEGAVFRSGLARLTEKQVGQVLQVGLGKFFPGMNLKKFDIKDLEAGWDQTPLRVEYELEIPLFARLKDHSLVIEKGLYPVKLGQMFLRAAEPKLPLLVSVSSNVHQEVVIKVPPGYIALPVGKLSLKSRFGEYELKTEVLAHGIGMDRRLVMPMARVEPGNFAEFANFCHKVDQSESREIDFEKRLK
ncbi:MAG: DUF3857 domain-containing protein [Deltaproteobacteria bacterium]|nr:DUF3857 domain-containing protein [Deltaproteobacteria bacterium]